MQALELNGGKFRAEILVEKLVSYGMMPQLVREMTLDRVTSDISLTPEEQKTANQQALQQLGIDSEEKLRAWLKQQGMTSADLEKRAEKSLKLAKFKQATWGSKVNSVFLERKKQLDRVIYSLICTKDFCIAQELYFRIKEGEQSFDELAREYSQGPESQTGGLIGPVEVGSIHPDLAKMLIASDVGQVQTPTVIGDWIVVVRLEKFLPVSLDEGIQRRLIDESFAKWLEENVAQQMATFVRG
ncbi:peptidylprolyl isomerase [Pseudanabaena yagii]|uniref:peptidylprolyl isomerase n=1 Tax=Pseudanabaena yagii GIHE-NHR1 TaxID=2722753 RepID=A0ABX1LT18_9CYAN|nr:peptidylprolyl isomerase [Pseudanabaena yagii]NMF59303.1 peptidylprolyl isomerase [Pseudanabaena yagii GIHE-NHR1]